MIVEEKKADLYWCPHVRHPAGDGGTFNRGADVDNEINSGFEGEKWSCACIGSRCMAWRWADPFNEGEDDLPASWRSTTHGYCGLGGRP